MYDLKVEVDEQEWQRILAMLKAAENMADLCQEALDLARTGLPPDAFNMDMPEWNTHKLHKIARELDTALTAWNKAKKGG